MGNAAMRGKDIGGIIEDGIWGVVDGLVSTGIGYGTDQITKKIADPLIKKMTSKISSSILSTFTIEFMNNKIRYDKSWNESFKEASDWRRLGFAVVEGTAKGYFDYYYENKQRETPDNDNLCNDTQKDFELDRTENTTITPLESLPYNPTITIPSYTISITMPNVYVSPQISIGYPKMVNDRWVWNYK
jgi:hypothetical protein